MVSGDGLSPVLCQAITWNKADLMYIEPSGCDPKPNNS